MRQENAPLSTLQRRFEKLVTHSQTLYVHAGLFIGAVLIGIARYGHAVPSRWTILMMLWSLGLLLHGVLSQRAGNTPTATRQRNGLLTTFQLAVIVNGVMWAMWTLASDAQDSMPWHLSVFVMFIVLGMSGLILVKRMLYAHWEKTYLRDSMAAPLEAKPKREDAIHLDDDGELIDYLDETTSRLSRRQRSAE